MLKSTFKNRIITKINILFYIGENKKTLFDTIAFLDGIKTYVQSISAYPLILYPNIMNKQNIISDLISHGGSIVTNNGWEERHLLAVNPSSEFTYTSLQHIGKLIAKSYQSINTFFEQRRFGYLDPNISFRTFREKAESFGIENLPFSIDKRDADLAKAEIMDIISK